MTPMQKFLSYVTKHDERYNSKNPHALAHYAGAMQQARDLISDETDMRQTVAALEKFFDSDFPPLKRLTKEVE